MPDAVERSARRPRADFERNRAEILRSAEKLFAVGGISSSLEAVAKDAGVGSATLYRHFPTRDAILAELLKARDAELGEQQAAIEAIDDPGVALDRWMAALEAYFSVFDGLPDPLRAALAEDHNPLFITCMGIIDVTDHFLEAAQREGVAHDWLRGKDLFLAALALTWIKGSNAADTTSHEHLRTLFYRGQA